MPGFFGSLKDRVGAGGGAFRAFRRGGDGDQDGQDGQEVDLESGKQSRMNRMTLSQSMMNSVKKSRLASQVSMMMENVPSNRFGGKLPHRALRGVYKGQNLRRHQALKLLKDPAEVKSLAKLRAKLKMTRQKDSDDKSGQAWPGKDKDKDKDKDDKEHHDHPNDDDDIDEELLDVIQELGLSVEPSVEELGDPTIIEQRKNGTLNVRDELTVLTFKRHKAKKGRVIFEAENSNNIACEIYMAGDIETAQLYFNRALELASQDRKPAAEELDELISFISEWYNSDEGEFYAALSEGEWRMALGRRRFVQVMKKLEYPGNPDRLFGMLDSLSPDGKISLPEIQVLTKLKPWRLLHMDRDLFEKGVVLSNLACCHLQKGEAIVGLQKLREAMTIVTGHGMGIEASTVQKIMGNIAVAYIKLGDLDAALDYLAQLVEIREKTAGRLNEGVLTALFHVGFCFLVKANTFNILGDCQRPDGRIQEKPVEVNFSLALCAFKERLRRQEEIFEDVDENRTQDAADEMRLEIARTQEIIAEIHEKCGEPHRSLEFLKQAVAHKEGILSDSDPELLSTWNIYAGISFKSGKFPEALDAMQKATDTSAALFGEASVTVAKELYHSGLILFKMGAQQFRTEERDASLNTYTEALEKLTQSMPIQEDLLGEDSADVADNIHLQGSIHLARNELVDARKNFEQALLCRLKCFGRTHIKVASSCHALGCLYSRMPRRREEAIQLLRKAVLIREKRLGHESLYLAESLHELGSALLQRVQGNDAEVALQHLSKAAAIRDNRVSKKSLLYAASMHQVGQAHLHLEFPAEAKLYFNAAVTLREELLGKKCAQTAASKFGLASALFELGDLKSSMKNFKASYTAREFLFGMEHPLSADSLHQIGQVYVKKKELQASLPFFLAALDIRKTLNQKDVERLENDSDEEEKYVYRPESERQRRIRHKKEKRRLENIKRRKEEAREEARRKAREEKEKAKAQEEERKRMLAEQRITNIMGGAITAGGKSLNLGSMLVSFGAKLRTFRSKMNGEGKDEEGAQENEEDENGHRKSRRSKRRSSVTSEFDGEERHSRRSSRKSRSSERRGSLASVSSANSTTEPALSEGLKRSSTSSTSSELKRSSTASSPELKRSSTSGTSASPELRRSGTTSTSSPKLDRAGSMGSTTSAQLEAATASMGSTDSAALDPVTASMGSLGSLGSRASRSSRRSKSVTMSLEESGSMASIAEDEDEIQRQASNGSLAGSAQMRKSGTASLERAGTASKLDRAGTNSKLDRASTGNLRSSLATGNRGGRGSVVSILSAASYVSSAPTSMAAAKRASRGSKKRGDGEDGEGSEEEGGSEAPSLFGEEEEHGEGGEMLRKSTGSQASLVRDEDKDSEVDISEIGIDVRGYMAPVLAYDFHIISRVYLDLKDYEKAKEYLDQSICLREEVFGSSSGEYAEALHAFGALFCKQGEAQSSLKYFLKALAVREKVCGHLHPDTAQTEIELGEALAEVGQPDEASIHLLRGCNIRESIFGNDDHYSKRLREKWSGLSAGATYFDPVAEGEALPHFARRSPESFLHGYAAAHLAGQTKKKAVAEDEGLDDDEYLDDEDEDDDDEEVDGDLFEDAPAQSAGGGDNEDAAEVASAGD